MMKMVVDPTFEDAHKYKLLGVADLLLPSQPFLRLYLTPRVWVLILALAAALTQVVVLALQWN